MGDNVTYEDNGTDKIYYTYDASGDLVSVNLNCTTNSAINGEYYYIRNNQGDIIGLHDSTGAEVVSYSYDSWGNLISTTGTLASTVGAKNPYRYRGYRYDTETSLYYLQSRYYNADWGRFVNADAIAGNVGELLGHNVFAYCKNNVVNMEDTSGYTTTAINPATLFFMMITAVIVYVYTSTVYITSVDIRSKVRDIVTSVTQSFSRVTKIPRYRTPMEIHHIVAQRAGLAEVARGILDFVGINVNDPINLVALKTGLHRRLHTTTYYLFVNRIIVNAYNPKLTKAVNKKRVSTALGHIRGFLLAMSGVSPF